MEAHLNRQAFKAGYAHLMDFLTLLFSIIVIGIAVLSASGCGLLVAAGAGAGAGYVAGHEAGEDEAEDHLARHDDDHDEDHD